MLEEEPPLCGNVSDPGHYGAKVFVAVCLLAHGVRVVDDEDGGVVLDAEPDVMRMKQMEGEGHMEHKNKYPVLTSSGR